MVDFWCEISHMWWIGNQYEICELGVAICSGIWSI